MTKKSVFFLAFIVLALANFVCDAVAFTQPSVKDMCGHFMNDDFAGKTTGAEENEGTSAIRPLMAPDSANYRAADMPKTDSVLQHSSIACNFTKSGNLIKSRKIVKSRANIKINANKKTSDGLKSPDNVMTINATMANGTVQNGVVPLKSGLAKLPGNFRATPEADPSNKTPDKGIFMQKNNDDRADIVRLDNFRYRIDRAANPSGEVIILLHGSGGDETTLFSFARPIWPQATLLGIRGRIVQNGETRWFKKITPTKFDQKDAVDEAEAFVKFLTDLGEEDQYDLSRATFVGYSNGANLLAVIMMRHPELVRRAVLLRSMPVLDSYPHKNLSKTNVLIISGKKDSLYSPFQPALSALLTENGAKVDSEIVNSDHMVGEKDREMIVKWLGNQNSSRILANTKTGKTAH